jgi:hypothetical protein
MVEFTALIVVKSFSVEPMESVAETVAFVRAIIGKTGTAEPELPLVRELKDTLEFTATNVGFVAVEPAVRAEPSWRARDPAEIVADWTTSLGWASPTSPLLRPMRTLPPRETDPDVVTRRSPSATLRDVNPVVGAVPSSSKAKAEPGLDSAATLSARPAG